MVTTLECTITGVTRSHCCRYSSCDNVSTVAEHVHHWRRLSQTLEPLEGVVDEDPVLVPVPDLVRLVLAVAVVQVVVVHTGDLEVDLDKK